MVSLTNVSYATSVLHPYFRGMQQRLGPERMNAKGASHERMVYPEVLELAFDRDY